MFEAVTLDLHSCDVEKWRLILWWFSIYLFGGKKIQFWKEAAALASVWDPAVMDRLGRNEKLFSLFPWVFRSKGVFLRNSTTCWEQNALWCGEEVLTVRLSVRSALRWSLQLFFTGWLRLAALVWNEQPGFRNLHPFEPCVFAPGYFPC